MLYEVLKTAKMGAGKAPDLYTALLAKNLRRDGEVKTLSGIPPLTFRSNGQPLIDYLISGNTVQNGTPSADNPIMPQGTGERTGNLFDYTKTDGIIANKYINQRNGSMVTDNEYYLSYPIKVNVGETYTWRFNSDSSLTTHTAPTVGFYDSSDNLLSTAQHDISVKYFSFEVPANCAYIRASVFTRSNTQKEAMLNSGSTPLPYEPYGYKIPISSANTTTPVYLGEVETTRKIKKLVFDGTESWESASSSAFRITITNAHGFNQNIIAPVYCSHYVAKTYTDIYNGNEYGIGVRGGNTESTRGFAISKGEITTVSDFKSYLQQQYAAGTPVCVWYVLATPETAVVNEPLQKIGDYADTVSMGQAEVQIPTAKGSTTLDVETTVKPSEVYIKYKS